MVTMTRAAPEAYRVNPGIESPKEPSRFTQPKQPAAIDAGWEQAYRNSLEPALLQHPYIRSHFKMSGLDNDRAIGQLVRDMGREPRKIARLLLERPNHPRAKHPEDAFRLSDYQHGQSHVFESNWYIKTPKFIALDHELLNAPYFRSVMAHGLDDASVKKMLSTMTLGQKRKAYRHVINAQFQSLPPEAPPSSLATWLNK